MGLLVSVIILNKKIVLWSKIGSYMKCVGHRALGNCVFLFCCKERICINSLTANLPLGLSCCHVLCIDLCLEKSTSRAHRVFHICKDCHSYLNISYLMSSVKYLNLLGTETGWGSSCFLVLLQIITLKVSLGLCGHWKIGIKCLQPHIFRL